MTTNFDVTKETGLYAFLTMDGKTLNLPILSSLVHGLVVQLEEKMHVVCEWDVRHSRGCFYIGNGEVAWFVIKGEV